MLSAEIRKRWLSYFEQRGHQVVESASLIADDPTLLLINAGMAPFKPYFLGEIPAPWPRATSVQKCVRTTDIEEVGKTTRHNSFFQMCGNFSFGDYFKEKAIPMAWELLTSSTADGGYGLDPDRLWITVYLDDDEAEDIWHKQVGVPKERIQRLGMAANFWSMGVPGPCGPCSEINYDRGPSFGPEGGPLKDTAGDRYLEIWNLVFMQNIRGEGSSKEGYPIVGDLPSKNIDTGLGLERLATLLQGVDNLYEIDTTRPILDLAAQLSGSKYGADHKSDISLRVVADHVRTATMLIADGVVPSNEGRGYVLRRILRRAIRNLRILGAHQPTMHELVGKTIGIMGPQYPELETDRKRIDTIAVAEEAAFLQTLKSGTSIFDLAAAETKAKGVNAISGDQAFQLHDTYGFPIDVTLEMAAEQGLAVDEDGFRRLMKEQRDRAKADAKAKKTGHVDVSAYREVLNSSGRSDFLGYTQTSAEGSVRGLLVAGSPAKAAYEGQEIEIILDRTPFYAEGGGQLADQGIIELGGGAVIHVDDVQTPIDGLVVHRGRVISGEVALGADVQAQIDLERRRAISRSHTATHLVHKAFRDALGESAAQAGSENGPGRFRFDFTTPGAVAPSVLHDVEQRINEVLIADLEVHAEVMPIKQAREIGAVAMFGEKYGEQVRVVTVGDYSRELCGGTHANRSGQLGVIKLLSAASIGSGVRRVEALVGTDAYRFLAREHALVAQLTDALKVRPEELPDRVAGMVSRLREVEKEIQSLRAAQVLQAAGAIADGASDVNGVAVVVRHLPEADNADDLRTLALDVRNRLSARPAVVAVSGVTGDRPVVVVAVNESARELGIKAGLLVRTAAKILGGGGGGRDDVAQGGGTNVTAIPEALGEIERTVGQHAASR
ncbi:alanine--tRNA ligase [Catellatospora tritici]|uniref:alanine--tRNA ligase n=1 Tax=Catellatospora tritici TaxID=2851566 RepID=UPI001C2D32FE|nr:alanine--tRNA ligase [Catellatospora tritici]MBV1852375.1 alanine--tRNA ligase [Catellatospora tritici]